MNDKELIQAIGMLDLAENEAKCYLALLKKDSLTASETARLSGVPRQNTYKALEKLSIKGLVVSIPGDIKRYTATDPRLFKDEAELKFKNSVENDLMELEKKRQEICKRKFHLDPKLNAAIKELDSLYSESRGNDDPLDYIEILKNPLQIHRKFLALYSKAEKEILAFTKPPFTYMSKKQAEEQFQVQYNATKRKAIQKTVIEMPPEDKAIEYFHMMDTGASKAPPEDNKYHKAKIFDKLPFKLFVFDSKACLFTLKDPIKSKTSMTMLFIEHESMAESFKFLFYSFWKKARDYYIVNNKKYYLFDPELDKDKQEDET